MQLKLLCSSQPKDFHVIHSPPPIRQLPLVPRSLLKKHRVLKRFDHRFRACARLLQALWREEQDLAMGTHREPSGRTRKIGSLLSASDAHDGRNFLTPALAQLARVEVAYQEPGALIDQKRLFANLLSSNPLAFNLAGPWRIDHKLAAQVLRQLFPSLDIDSVEDVRFEHSPGRLDPLFTGDRSAFDVAVVYARSDGARGLLGVEVKYSETSFEPAPPELRPSYERLAVYSTLYKEPHHAALRVNPLQQYFREHLLAFAALEAGLYAEAHLLVLTPHHNQLIQRSAALYRSFLDNRTDTLVPFHVVELEQVISAFAAAGETEYAQALQLRYCDWSAIDELVRDALVVPRIWTLPLARRTPLQLLERAA